MAKIRTPRLARFAALCDSPRWLKTRSDGADVADCCLTLQCVLAVRHNAYYDCVDVCDVTVAWRLDLFVALSLREMHSFITC